MNRVSETCQTQPSIGTMAYPKGNERKNQAKCIFEEIMSESFPNFISKKKENMNLYLQETKETQVG